MSAYIIIFEAVLSSTLSILIICCTGAYLYKYKLINAEFTKLLSGIVGKVFLPCLIVSNIIKSLTYEDLVELLPVLFSAILVCGIGYIVGNISNKILIKDQKYNYLIILACANPHTTTIQLQLCIQLQQLFNNITKIQKYRNSVDGGTRAIVIVMIYTAVSNTFRWTIGKNIQLKFARLDKVNKYRQQQIEMFNMNNNYDIKQSQQQQQQQQQQQNLSNELIQDQNLSIKQNIQNTMSMPLISILCSFIILFIPPLQQLLIGPQGFVSNAIFQPINTLGKATNSCVLIILGSTLYQIIEKVGYYGNNSISKKTLIQLSLTKLIIMPFIGFILVMIFSLLDILKDPVAIFMTLFTFGCPSAINIIVQAKQYTECEDIVSMILVYSYLCAIITLPFCSILIFNLMYSIEM